MKLRGRPKPLSCFGGVKAGAFGKRRAVTVTGPGPGGARFPSSPGRRASPRRRWPFGTGVRGRPRPPGSKRLTRGGAGPGRALGEAAAPPGRAPRRRQQPREGHTVTRGGQPGPAAAAAPPLRAGTLRQRPPAACCGLRRPSPPRGCAGTVGGEAGGGQAGEASPPRAPAGPQRPGAAQPERREKGKGRGGGGREPGRRAGPAGRGPGPSPGGGGGTAAWIPAGEATGSAAAAARRTHTHPAALRPRFRRRDHAPSGARGRHRPLPPTPLGRRRPAAGARLL